MSKLVYVQLHGCFGLPKGAYEFVGSVQPMNVKTTHKCVQDIARNLTICKKYLELSVGSRYDNTLVLSIRDNNKHDCCRVALPMCWFPCDQTVRAWFPMNSYVSGVVGSYMAEIEVHIRKNFAYTPFGAPKSPLLVLPAWNQPNKPALPPKPYGPVPPGVTRLPVPKPPKPATHASDAAKTKALPQVTIVYGKPAQPAPLPPGCVPSPQPVYAAPPPQYAPPGYPPVTSYGAPPPMQPSGYPAYPAYPSYSTDTGAPEPNPYAHLP